jgi:serine protease Do
MSKGMLALGALLLSAAPLVAGSERSAAPKVMEAWSFSSGGAWLGVDLADVRPADVEKLKLSAERGAVVEDVKEGSPADKAGLRDGDVIVAFDGEAVRSAAQLARLVRETPAGRAVDVGLSRDGRREQAKVTLDERRGPMGRLDGDLLPPVRPMAIPRLPEGLSAPGLPGGGRPGAGTRRLGVGYREVRGEEAARLKAPHSGILVTSVENDMPAAKAGIRVGDVIVAVDAGPVRDGQSLRMTLHGALRDAGRREILLSVVRDGETIEVPVRFD